MNRKPTVAILFGGKSVEHKVSLRSAKNIIENIDRQKYNVTLLGIDQEGSWYCLDAFSFDIKGGEPVGIRLTQHKDIFYRTESSKPVGEIDVIFPILHGNDGEDGSIQGFFRTLDIPFVGTGVLGSSVAFDKLCTKKLLKDAGIPMADYLSFEFEEKDSIRFADIIKKIGLPFFIKPVASGSSVGVFKITGEAGFRESLEEAFQYDNRVLIEEYIDGREIECAVMGNEQVKASLPGEIKVKGSHDFYSFDAKYVDDKGAQLDMPANLSDDTIRNVQELAISAYKALYCEDFARVDMFLRKDAKLIINEVNTIPGFTHISMFPQLWTLTNMTYTSLITYLIETAIKRYNRQNRVKREFDSAL